MPHEFDGEQYKRASTHQKEWGNKIISELKLRGDEHILDMGCGDGLLTAALAELVPDGFALGIDGSSSMIETAAKLSRKNLFFRVLDINSIDFTTEFDLVFSNATLHWIKDHELLLGNTFRALKANGILRFNFASDGNCSNFIKTATEAIALPKYVKYFYRFKWPWYMPALESYEALARKFPFKEIKVWGENADRCFPDIDAMVKWVDQPSLVPFLEHLPPYEKKNFRAIVVEKMIKATLQADGRCFESFRRINLLARK
jgi:trans-aconitate 2-methyltransferase